MVVSFIAGHPTVPHAPNVKVSSCRIEVLSVSPIPVTSSKAPLLFYKHKALSHHKRTGFDPVDLQNQHFDLLFRTMENARAGLHEIDLHDSCLDNHTTCYLTTRQNAERFTGGFLRMNLVSEHEARS